jgi:hypothetical protein
MSDAGHARPRSVSAASEMYLLYLAYSLKFWRIMHSFGDSLICVCTRVWILAAGPRRDRSRYYLHPNQPTSGSSECSTWISDLKFNLTPICPQLKFDPQFMSNSIHVICYRIQACGITLLEVHYLWRWDSGPLFLELHATLRVDNDWGDALTLWLCIYFLVNAWLHIISTCSLPQLDTCLMI